MKLRSHETVHGLHNYIGKLRTSTRHYTTIGLVALLFITDFTAQAQCVPPSMSFKNPVLVGGRAGRVGAIYKFSTVATGIDCYITIQTLAGGAALGEIDNTTQGYFDAWQPYVTAGAKATSYLDWKINFKKAGTTTDTLLPCLAITAIDVDGDGSKLREFIVASTPGAYAVDPFTSLAVTFDGINSTAIGSYVTVPSIDTNARKAMFQMNFTNVSTIIYRNGSISEKNTTDDRHTCIYFKSFFANGLITLPVNLLSFTGKAINESIQLNWIVAGESDMDHYVVQRSIDGENWMSVGKVNAVNNSSGNHTYLYYDKGAGAGSTYYRLQQVTNRMQSSLSQVVIVNNANGGLAINSPTLITGNNISLQMQAPKNEAYTIGLFTIQGQLILRQKYAAIRGANPIQVNLPANKTPGIYLLTIQNNQGTIVYRNPIVVQ